MVWTCRKLPDGNGKNNESCRAHLSPVFICPDRFSFASGPVFRLYPAGSFMIAIILRFHLNQAVYFFIYSENSAFLPRL